MRRWLRFAGCLQANTFCAALIGGAGLVSGCQAIQTEKIEGPATALRGSGVSTPDNSNPAEPQLSEVAVTVKSPSPIARKSESTAAQTAESAIVQNLNRGHRAAAMGHPDQAIVAYRAVLRDDPENPIANHRLAILADQSHDFLAAESHYLAALHRDPRNTDLLSDLGYSYFLQGRGSESERCLQAAVRLSPLHAKGLHNLGLLYAQRGDYDRSFDAIRRSAGDRQARIEIARLFPDGRPDESEGVVVASFQTTDKTSGPRIAPGVQPKKRAASREFSASASSPALQSSPKRTFDPAAGNKSDDANDFGDAVGSSNAVARSRVPDSQLNDVLSAIDREDASPVGTPTITPTNGAAGSFSEAPLIQPGPTRQPVRTSGSGVSSTSTSTTPIDPLDSMPLWSPGDATSQNSTACQTQAPNSGVPSNAGSIPSSSSERRPRATVTDILPASGAPDGP
jgi:hypothetical protein